MNYSGMMGTKKHEIDISIDEIGHITATVGGVSGQACSDISKWLDQIGVVTEDRHTQDYYKSPDQNVMIKR